jgi:hypothetical protein
MYPVAVEVNEQEEIVISQDRKDPGEAATVTITMEQVDYLYDLLQRARKEIEERREKKEEGVEEERGFSGRRR